MMLGAAAHFGHLPCLVVSDSVTGSSSTISTLKQKKGRPATGRPTASAKGSAPSALGSSDVANGDLAGAAIFLRVERDLLAFVQRAHSSALEGGRMDEHVLAAIIGLNETKAFLIVVEFDGTDLHVSFLNLHKQKRCARCEAWQAGGRFLEIV